MAKRHRHILALLANLLSGSGHRVITAADGQEALKYLESVKVDLLITDVMMPRMNGYQLIHAITAERQDIPTPKIIILTSRSEPADIKRGLSVGADIYIPKPFDLTEMSAQVNELLDSIKKE